MLHLWMYYLIFLKYMSGFCQWDGYNCVEATLLFRAIVQQFIWEGAMKIREGTNLIAGILFTLVAGILLHFVYEWSMENPFVALFAPVNESVWEHLKMLFFPAFLYTLFEVIVLFKTSGRFLTSRICGVLLGMFFIVAGFFTYTGISGKDYLVVDILIFVVSVLVTFLTSRYFEVQCPGIHLPLLANYALLLLLVICFFSFTFSPPGLPMFYTV